MEGEIRKGKLGGPVGILEHARVEDDVSQLHALVVDGVVDLADEFLKDFLMINGHSRVDLGSVQWQKQDTTYAYAFIARDITLLDGASALSLLRLNQVE
jgi:hypothetical protein